MKDQIELVEWDGEVKELGWKWFLPVQYECNGKEVEAAIIKKKGKGMALVGIDDSNAGQCHFICYLDSLHSQNCYLILKKMEG